MGEYPKVSKNSKYFWMRIFWVFGYSHSYDGGISKTIHIFCLLGFGGERCFCLKSFEQNFFKASIFSSKKFVAETHWAEALTIRLVTIFSQYTCSPNKPNIFWVEVRFCWIIVWSTMFQSELFGPKSLSTVFQSMTCKFASLNSLSNELQFAIH